MQMCIFYLLTIRVEIWLRRLQVSTSFFRFRNSEERFRKTHIFSVAEFNISDQPRILRSNDIRPGDTNSLLRCDANAVLSPGKTYNFRNLNII